MATANTVATPYTSSQGANQDRLTTLADEISKGYSGLPSMREQIANEAMKQENLMGPLQEQKGNIISQLFDFDRQYSQKYAEPTSSTFIENPMARSRGITSATAPMWGALSTLTGDIATRRALLGDSITNAIEARKLELAGKQQQYNSMLELYKLKQAQEQEERDRLAAEKKLTQVDLGDRIALIDALGNEVKSYPKGVVGGTGIPASILKDAIYKDQGITPTETVETPSESDIEEYDYPNLDDKEKQIFLVEKYQNKGILSFTEAQKADWVKLVQNRGVYSAIRPKTFAESLAEGKLNDNSAEAALKNLGIPTSGLKVTGNAPAPKFNSPNGLPANW